jgi:endonuclease/exonuclease/phosphatase family metal-dependent hydrolase
VPRPSRPFLLDVSVVVAIVALVGALIAAQVWFGGSDTSTVPTATDSASAAIQHSSLGPSPSVSGTPVDRSTPAPTAPPVEAQASLAQRAQSNADAGLEFRVATFNVLGASHTAKNGDSSIKTPYSQRMQYAIQVLAAHKADVVGFQEFEDAQAKLFDSLVGPVWGLWPSAGGKGASGSNSIGYLKKKWELVTGTSLTIPYFKGWRVATPVALLRDRATGRKVWFISVHNPASLRQFGDQSTFRADAVAKEMSAIRQLSADGTPVVLIGDMNSRRDFYCSAAGSGLHLTFPNPGGVNAAGECVAPSTSNVDWIVGTRAITWSGYVQDRSELTRQATDHPVYSASATVGSGQNQ